MCHFLSSAVCFASFVSMVTPHGCDGYYQRVESAEMNDLIVQCLNPDDLCSDVSLCLYSVSLTPDQICFCQSYSSNHSHSLLFFSIRFSHEDRDVSLHISD